MTHFSYCQIVLVLDPTFDVEYHDTIGTISSTSSSYSGAIAH